MRILITGDRRWPKPKIEMIENAIAQAVLDRNLQPPWHLVVGDSKGTDRYARTIWEEWGHKYEIFTADWYGPCTRLCRKNHRRINKKNGKSYCPAAGPFRNQRMVDTRPDLVLAFVVKNRSIGTWDCIRRAYKAGIPIIITYSDGTVETR